MKAFSDLFTNIDETTSTNEKIDALVAYFAKADPEDAIWCVALLSGRRPKRTVKTSELWEWSGELSGLPVWLQAESYHIVGDLAETISLILPKNTSTRVPAASRAGRGLDHCPALKEMRARCMSPSRIDKPFDDRILQPG